MNNHSTAEEVESELSRQVAYFPGGKDRTGVPIIIVPVGPDVSRLCHVAEDDKLCNESFSSDATQLTRNEEEHCQDLHRILLYLHGVIW